MEEFLSNALLYQKYIIQPNFEQDKRYFDRDHFNGQTFEYYCEIEQKNTTFELEISNPRRMTYPQLDESVFDGDYLNYTFPAICVCKSCKRNKLYLLINVFSDKPISDIIFAAGSIHINYKNDIYNKDTNIIAQKVGVYPERRMHVNKDVEKFFCRETKAFYYKGIKSINENFGVGALAYFRRIIEKELLNIIDAIKELPDADKVMIEKLIKEHEQNPSVSTIYSNIQNYLPSSLRMLGDNPIKLLYNQTSEGLHSLTETESIEKANKILKLLEFVILKINEEKSIVNDIKSIIKDLKK